MVDFPSEKGPMCGWSRVEAVPGARTTLAELSRSSRCALATNAADSTEAQIRKALDRAGLSPYIEKIFCRQNTGFKKPSPRFFQTLCAGLKTDPGQVILVGDSLENDVLGALDFGFDAVWYNRDRKTVPKGIKSITRLSQLLD